MSTVTRKRVIEVIRLLEEMADPPQSIDALAGSLLKKEEDPMFSQPSPFKDNLSPIQVATIQEATSILKGYLRVLIMIQQFRVAFLAFFTHYPELFGEQDERGPYD